MAQLALNLVHRTSLRGEDFFVSESNREAVSAIDQWPEWPHYAYALTGPVGSGKTHLASVWQERSGADVVEGAELCFRSFEKVEPGSRLVLETADQVTDEEALLHLLNWVKEGQGFLLLTSRTPLARISYTLPDLTSRLTAIPSAELGAPDDPLLSAMMTKQFADRQLAVDDAVVEYLLSRIERSAAAVAEMVGRLDSASLAEGRRITVPLARKVLETLSD